MTFIASLEPYQIWLALGLVLAVLELIVPGVFLIWFSVAALITGALSYVLPINVGVQMLFFALASLASVWAARRFFILSPIGSADPLLNQKGARLIGEIAVVSDAIEGGRGRVKIGDSEWNAAGDDMPVGTRVKVAGVDGNRVLVEAV